jgi:hypothetical protein
MLRVAPGSCVELHMRIFALAALMLLVGCRAMLHGQVAKAGPAVATVTTSEPGGLRVLASALTDVERIFTETAAVATTPDELAALWSDVGLDRREVPTVDFASHVVIGAAIGGGSCDVDEIVAAHLDARGTLTLEDVRDSSSCDEMLIGIARVVAVPRSFIGPRFTWRIDDFTARMFEVPQDRPWPLASVWPPPMRAQAAVTAMLEASISLERSTIPAPRGVVELPARGHLASRTLDDGRAVWVVHRADGEVSVLLADETVEILGIEEDPEVRFQVRWESCAGRFYSWDSRGRSVLGGSPLPTLAFARVAGSRIAIGEPVALPGGPIEPRAAAPVLDGGDAPYESLAPGPLDAIPDGHFGSVAHSLIFGPDGVPRLCTPPQDELRGRAPRCPANAPALIGGRSRQNTNAFIPGPVVVRRRGSGADVVIELDGTICAKTLPCASQGACEE